MAKKKKKPIILIDMDGVLADFDNGLIDIWKVKHPNKPYVPLEERTSFYSINEYPLLHRPLVWKVMMEEDFFINLPPIAGSIKAVKKVARSGFKVRFCSSPLIPNKTGASQKYQWIGKHFGPQWMGKLILAPDKTYVHGDVLIDDRPEIKGDQTPSWEHVLYDQPYNRQIKGQRRMTWANWQEILL